MPGSPFADLRFQEAFRNLQQAVSLQNQGAFDHADKKFSQLVKKNPDYFDALHLYGLFKYQRGSLDEAHRLVSRATRLNPRSANGFNSLGVIQARLGRHSDALASFDAALNVEPNNVRALGNRCNSLNELGHYNEAIASSERALAFDRNYVEVYIPRGAALIRCGRYADALQSYQQAIRLNPNLAIAWVGLGNVSFYRDAHNEALTNYDKALALQPDLAEAWNGRGRALFHINRPAEAIAAFDKALSIQDNISDAISNRIFALDFLESAGFAEHQEARDYWWRKVGSAIAKTSRIRHTNTRESDRRIRIGYVSADFRHHATGLVFRPVLLNHDKSQFEIVCYSSGHIQDEVTRDFQLAADLWRDVAQSSDDELCGQIVTDQIDVLVDLSGHSAGNRLGVFARKPAPIQITAWGHVTGTGLPTIDYLFADPVLCPETIRPMLAETVFDLPCFLTIDPLPEQVAPSLPPVLSKGYVTFGVFNRASKISDDSVAVWARILDALPGSRMTMKHYAFDEPAMRELQLERFARHGIAADRLAFLGKTPRPDHLAAFRDIDISFDPFPMNGGVSTWESLQMGVPVVAKLGNTMASRSAGAILASVGLGDWVADTAEGYFDIAVKFAAMPEQLKILRSTMPQRLFESAAGNSIQYTRAVEAAYRTMWTDYCGKAR
jgi:predicted O-linked N-acetylglucosamine transferase (SPINDLY family)